MFSASGFNVSRLEIALQSNKEIFPHHSRPNDKKHFGLLFAMTNTKFRDQVLRGALRDEVSVLNGLAWPFHLGL